jgi:hypothetical protein
MPDKSQPVPEQLHNAIMNLRADKVGLQPSPMRAAYREGHRDARHAAAELASDADAAVATLRQQQADAMALLNELKEDARIVRLSLSKAEAHVDRLHARCQQQAEDAKYIARLQSALEGLVAVLTVSGQDAYRYSALEYAFAVLKERAE